MEKLLIINRRKKHAKNRKWIETTPSLLHLRPYCKHRSKTGNGYDVRRHMKKCSEKRKVKLEPIKIPTLEKFLSFPPLPTSSCAKMNLEQTENALVKCYENKYL